MLVLSLRLRIDGSNILITGASSGIGAAVAQELTRRGARVAAVSRRAVPGVASSIQADLSDPAQRARAYADSESAIGPIDILINNAGIGIYAPSWRTPLPDLRHIFEVNFFAAVELTQLAVPGMRERQRGLVVNVSSIAGRVTLPWFTLYSASKAAVDGFTRGLRTELRHSGVKVMLVCPGYVKTAFQSSVLGGHPPPRLAHNKRFATTPEAVARAMAEGMERDRRTVMLPAAAWGLVAASGLAPGKIDNVLAGILESAGNE